MPLKRVVVCLDIAAGRVVKGVSFRGLRDVGDPVELAERYEAEGADEIVFLDISASVEGRRTLLETVSRTAERLFIPLTVGGGIDDVEGVAAALRAGADKVSINTAAVKRPGLITEASARFGSQCIVASIDARAERQATGSAASPAAPAASPAAPAASPAAPAASPAARYRVFTHGGRRPTQLGAVAWARKCAALGAGEILVTSIDRDGRRDGYDLELTASTAAAVNVPVIASGGAGQTHHVRDVFLRTAADAALVAGIFHDGSISVRAVKQALAEARIPVRAIEAAESTKRRTGSDPLDVVVES